MSTLDALSRTGPQRVSGLVTQERITQPGMTGLVARLAAAGLVERSPDPRDGRATLVAITPAGREYVATFHESRARTVAAHVGNLPDEQQRALLSATAALTALAAQPIAEDAVRGDRR
nr:MarR family transcriptional regulator [Pseudonocardia acidicola]